MKRVILVSSLVIVITGAALAFIFREQIITWFFRPTTSQLPTGASINNQTAADLTLTTFADKLDTPWAIAWLPNGDMLATERSGTLRLFGTNGQSFTINGVRATSEGGLLGLAVHPDFDNNKLLYIYLTTNGSGGTENRVDRYTLNGTVLTFQRSVIIGIPSASNHNGGGIAFGPDAKLYVTTGDAARADSAQDTTSLAGKILRINDDGSIPSDNPFSNAVWSYWSP